MPITITAAEIKRKAMIAADDSSHDSDIAALIAEMQPALEHEIYPQCLENTADTGLQSLIKLGMLEIIAGEYLEQCMREEGASESFSAAGITVGAPLRPGVDLIAQGTARLSGYTRDAYSPVSSNTANSQSAFQQEEPDNETL